VAVVFGADKNLVDLWPESFQHMGDHGFAGKWHQPLVDAPHAAREAAGQHNAADAYAVDAHDAACLRKTLVVMANRNAGVIP